MRQGVSVTNVKMIFYVVDDKDSTFIGLNYVETDTVRLYLSEERKLQRVWMRPKPVGTTYPMTQIPPQQYYLKEFAWFEDLRPTDKNDIFLWRGKPEDDKLKEQERFAAPLQKLDD